MITRLVINGCSYMYRYALGDGHVDLAKILAIPNAESLALFASSNSRIIRTTLKDSYATAEKTLYIVGVTFLGRAEIPTGYNNDKFEGRWLSIQNYLNPYHKHFDHWTTNDLQTYIDLKVKSEMFTEEDRLENLMYQLLSMIGDLKNRGHQVVVFRNPGDCYDNLLTKERFTKLAECVNIIDGLKWIAIPWQQEQGIKFDPEDSKFGSDIRHPLPGEHGSLNNFLVDYIRKNDIYLPVL